MKLNFYTIAVLLSGVAVACASSQERKNFADQLQWRDYNVGEVVFEDKAPQTKGSGIYRRIIPDPESYITEQARTVLSILYCSPQDSIPPVYRIHYSIDDIDGISAKGGCPGYADIYYSTRYIESFAEEDTTKFLFETRGVLLHELTHVYQLEPQGIGSYGDSRTFWAFIEGMADAVRIAGGGFGADARPKGGNYMDGYRTTGYFLVWVRDNKDPEFLRKFNRSALEVVPWSFEGAFRHIFGKGCDVDTLWHEYQVSVGDIQD